MSLRPRSPRRMAVGVAWLAMTKLSFAADVEIPAPYQQANQQAVELGARLWRHDDAGARANAELSKRNILQKDKRITGWITDDIEADAGVAVTFVGEQGGAPVALYRLTVAGDDPPDTVKIEPAAPLTDSQAARWRARQAALQQLRFRGELCSGSYRAVTLPGVPGSDRILVYLMVPAENPEDLAAGGHLRFEYSADGSIMEASRTFTRSCMIIAAPPKSSAPAEAFMLTHLLDPTPTEIHVYLSLRHHKPVFVGTKEFIWSVEGAKIRAIDRNGE